MAKALQQAIAEIVEVVKTVPSNLQEKCFELLLSDYLAGGRGGEDTLGEKTPGDDTTDAGGAATGEDLQVKDIHTKARNFLKKHDLTIGDLNELFYKEDGEFKPLYDDLKSTSMAESQIRIALLQALLNGMKSGEFFFRREEVRTEAKQRKCYDQANFAKSFSSSESLFVDKDAQEVKLADEGRAKLAEVVKAIQ